jgi:hypothetical protein
MNFSDDNGWQILTLDVCSILVMEMAVNFFYIPMKCNKGSINISFLSIISCKNCF